MADKPVIRIVGKRRKEPDLQLVASAIIDLVLRQQAEEEARAAGSESSSDGEAA